MATAERIEDLKTLIAACERGLATLDQKAGELRLMITEDEADPRADGAHPYIYHALGADGNPGVLVGTGAPVIQSGVTNRLLWRGTIQVQSDAPFVVTGVMACQRWDVGKVSNTNVFGAGLIEFDIASFRGLQAPGWLAPGSSPDISIGFIDQSSGRVLFQAERFDRAAIGNPNDVGELLSSELFNTMRMYARPNVTVALPRMPVASMGNGPNAPFDLITDYMLPANCAMEVDIRSTFFDAVFAAQPTSTALRVYVAMLGYKVLV